MTKVIKFGGSSVANAERIKQVVTIINAAQQQQAVLVVVSALQGITNQLLQAAELAAVGNHQYRELYQLIVHDHQQVLQELCGDAQNESIKECLAKLLQELANVLQGIYLLQHSSPQALDLVASFGERLAAAITTCYMLQVNLTAKFVDARQFIITDDHFTHAAVQFTPTNHLIAKYFDDLFQKQPKAIPVITGFIGATTEGRTTTIGRNGSDYSAAIIGAALNVNNIEIWTDVDGIYSADPRIVPSALVLSQLSYEEAMELSYFGAKVLHAASIAPAVTKKIPIIIKNTFNPAAPGTIISEQTQTSSDVAKGITTIDNMALLTLRGMSMVGVPGTAERLFRALATNHINIILISQASSEHTICCAVHGKDIAKAKQAIAQEFCYEFANNFTDIEVKAQQTILTIVGEGMKGAPGVAGKVFQALGRNNININAIAQGASEHNISTVVATQQSHRALNVIHQAFFEKRKRLDIFLVGVGNIGSALLNQVQQQRDYLLSHGFDLRVCGLANSKKFVLHSEGIELQQWKELLEQSNNQFAIDQLLGQIEQENFTNLALIDCTASAEVIANYPKFVTSNMHIITPNKKANVLPWNDYQNLLNLLKQRQKYFLYEANVGAGLPIISTLRDLIAGGDEIVKIEGIFSGTLSYLFNHFSEIQSFSELVKLAQEKGYTEPDPRDDLSGLDVGRKLLILARQLGLQLELHDVSIENLVPKNLQQNEFSLAFYESFKQIDASMQARAKQAKAKDATLRYVATLAGNSAQACLQEVPLDHPLAATKGSDNIIAFTTKRYHHTPLVVQGPGAGAEVTAMGVFSDILKLLHYLPD